MLLNIYRAMENYPFPNTHSSEVEKCYSRVVILKCGSWTSSGSISRDLVRNATSRTPPDPLRRGLSPVFTSPLMRDTFENHCSWAIRTRGLKPHSSPLMLTSLQRPKQNEHQCIWPVKFYHY